MEGKVRPQIYATTSLAQVRSELNRDIMPAPFVRRMRVVNLLTALTLRKIEDDIIAPFTVMDIHHVLDEQISQDAIIAMLENKNLALALETGDMRPLWVESQNMPLLRKGFEQQWIQRFITTPFDPICVMLAMRAKLMLDAIDELGHSYNLLRSLGMGWIDFGEIPGEDPGDPDSYVPPILRTPIDPPVLPGDQAPVDGDGAPAPGEPGYVAPGDLQPGDPGYTTTPGSPGYIPPGSLSPGDPGYTTTPGSPGYIPPADPMPGEPGYVYTPTERAPREPLWDRPMYRAEFANVVQAMNLAYGPGALFGGSTQGQPNPDPGVNCCLNKDNPDLTVDIGFITDEIKAGETLDLTVLHQPETCEGDQYEWVEVNEVGSLSAETGLAVVYTAPETGAGCPGNADVCLICGGDVVDTLLIKIDYEYAISFIYEEPEPTLGPNQSMMIYINGNGSPYTWEVAGTRFTLDHVETESRGNTLRATSDVCGSAEITVTDCDGNQAKGWIRSTIGQWVACGQAAISRCAGGGDCWGPCSVYYGSGTWYKNAFSMSIAKMFSSCESGTDENNAGVWHHDTFISPGNIRSGKTGLYHASGDGAYDNIAYYKVWSC